MMSVAEEFIEFKNRYNIGREQIATIAYRYKRITCQLNWSFRESVSETANSLYVGSYGRDTAASGISDVDMAFLLPSALYHQHNSYQSNGQSALLQLVRNSIKATYSNTACSGDGQVVTVQFSDGLKIEVLPAFTNQDGTWTYPNSNNGGSWNVCNPRAEITALHARNLATNRNLKHLCRMMRVWRVYNNVSISGALIDTLAYQFIEIWPYRDKSFLYHDYMARDFLQFMANQDKSQLYWRMPGSGSYVYRKGNFQTKAATDFQLGSQACELQGDHNTHKRRAKWRMVFGPTFPA